MGGNERERGRGRMMSLGRVEASSSLTRELERECGGETTSAGIFLEAAVDGLMSWAGSGWRLREADWMVDASSVARLFAIVGKDSKFAVEFCGGSVEIGIALSC